LKINFNLFFTCLFYFFLSNNLYAIEDKLIGIQLGTTVQELYKKYPNIYKHKLILGEVLYEACNQDKLEVITFTENPWSKSFITYIMLRQEKDVSVCRDETGALPDFNITIETLRGIRLGDSKDKIITQYGEPDEIKRVSKNETVLTYKGEGKIVKNLRLIFVLNDDNSVTDISLIGDIPNTHPPFGNHKVENERG